MRRTTIRLEEDLLRAAKTTAAESGQTLTALIADCVRERVARRQRTKRRRPVKLITFKGSGVRPGVDLDNSAALLDLMEEGDGPLRR